MSAAAPSVYDPRWRLMTGSAYGTGYHTRLEPGTPVHPIRESVYEAVRLLASGDDAQAFALIDGVLVHQDVDPYAPTYGIWPWFADEPLSEMAPPDWNWADFIGTQLCEVLVRFGDRLPAVLKARVEDALGHAAWSIFRRNIQPGYTNIAIMGAVVAAAAGEILGEARLLAYGRRRLAVFLAQTEEVGGFAEYNSPTYTIVALEEVERVMRLVRDAEVRVVAERLRRIAWTMIAEHWHPGTGEWAGPHARAYGDRVSSGLTATLAHKTGRITVGSGAEAADWAVLGPLCPEDLARRFASLPERQTEIRRRFSRNADPAKEIVGTTWMDGDACLGTVNRGTTWTQSRAVLGYWRIEGHPAAVLRVRLLKDGRDFASGVLLTAQSANRALVSLGLATDQGDWHCSLDRPADGAFTVSDLRLRITLEGHGATILQDGDGWLLRAGAGSARIRLPAANRFDGASVGGEPGQADAAAHLDLVLMTSSARRVRPADLGAVCVGLGIEVCGAGLPSAIAAPTGTIGDDGLVRLSWAGLSVSHRDRAGPAYG